MYKRQTEDSVTVLGVSKHSKDAAEGVNAIVGLAESLSPVSYTHLDVYKRQQLKIVEEKGDLAELLAENLGVEKVTLIPCGGRCV